MNKIRLSQCMIVKNEEQNIRQALSWGKGIVCEQIVVDTGSTDHTVKIAEEMGAKVFHFPWIEDFSAAKNFAIEQATGEWIAFLDADESFAKQDAAKVLPLLEKVEKKRGTDGTEVIVTKLVSLDDDGKPFSETRHNRIFRNKAGIRYHNRIHEQLKVQENGKYRLPVGLDASEQLTIYHTGYAPSVYEQTKKLERNISMLQNEIEKNPKDWKMKVYLAESLAANGQRIESDIILNEVYEKGLDQLEEAVQNVLFSQMLKNIVIEDRSRQEDRDRLFEVYKKARELGNNNPDFDFILGLWLLHREEYEEVLFYMQKALENVAVFQEKMSLQLSTKYDTLYHAMTQASLKLGHYADVVRYGVLCLKVQPYTTEVLAILLTLLKDEPGESEHASGTFGILKQIYQFTTLKDKIYVQRCAKAVGFWKLEQVLEALFTAEEKRLRDSL